LQKGFEVDANVIFSLLISKNPAIEIIFDSDFRFYIPSFLFDEIIKHKDIILSKTKRKKKEFEDILYFLEERLIFVNHYDFIQNLEEAYIISPEQDDAAYFAIALKYKLPIWSNDKRIKRQNVVTILNTKEMIENFWR
jgi:predicted nucleic acid-binding protein